MKRILSLAIFVLSLLSVQTHALGLVTVHFRTTADGARKTSQGFIAKGLVNDSLRFLIFKNSNSSKISAIESLTFEDEAGESFSIRGEGLIPTESHGFVSVRLSPVDFPIIEDRNFVFAINLKDRQLRHENSNWSRSRKQFEQIKSQTKLKMSMGALIEIISDYELSSSTIDDEEDDHSEGVRTDGRPIEKIDN